MDTERLIFILETWTAARLWAANLAVPTYFRYDCTRGGRFKDIVYRLDVAEVREGTSRTSFDWCSSDWEVSGGKVRDLSESSI